MLAHGTGADQGNLLLAGARVESDSGHVSLLAARNLDVVHHILATAGNKYLHLSSDLVAPQGDIHRTSDTAGPSRRGR